MKISLIIVLFLTVFLPADPIYSQSDTLEKSYARMNASIGVSLNYFDLENLKNEGYMLGIPSNLQFFPLQGCFSIGKRDKFYGSLDYGGGGQKTKGAYTSGLNTFDKMDVSVYTTRWGLILNRNLVFKKHFALDASIGSSLLYSFVSSVNNYAPTTQQLFASAKITQHGSIYVGTAMRFFWTHKRQGDLGFSLKLGYNVPTSKPLWNTGYVYMATIPKVDLSGPVVSLSLYTWPYSSKYTMKMLAQDPRYKLYDSIRVADSTRRYGAGNRNSMMQWDIGLTALQLNDRFVLAFDGTFLGFVFRKKYISSLGVVAYNGNSINETSKPPAAIDGYLSMYWNNEYIVNPEKKISYSFPLKIGFSTAWGWDTINPNTGGQVLINWNNSGKDYYMVEGGFWSIAPGSNLIIRLFKTFSLGLGVNYRIAVAVPEIIPNNFGLSGFSALAFIRIGLDPYAVDKKMRGKKKPDS